MKKRFALAVLVLFACLFAFPIPAFADTGPKPSVIVTFQGIKQKNCYVTLLAKEKSTGPHSIYNPADGQNKDTGDAPEIWQKFVDYKDADGYHFLQFYQKLGSDGVFKWGYHPPQEFKILMYSQDDNRFTVSRETYQPYAFKSYFTVDASSLNASSSGVSSVQSGVVIRAVKSYNYEKERWSLLARTIITIVIELLIALPFGYRAKRQLGFLALVNVATQLILNVLLNVVNYKQGWLAFSLTYILLELVVFAIEAVVYKNSVTLLKYAVPGKEPHPVLYAFVANLASYVAGIFLAFRIPEIF